jgi:hypothetical protein
LEYIIYADESEEDGPFFSNFYGGLLVRSPDLKSVVGCLEASKEELRLGGKAKWQKVTPQYLEKYKALMEAFFDLVEADQVKVRIMFLQRINVAVGLSHDQKKSSYFRLYYQFLKHAFGLQYSNDGQTPISMRLYLDRRSATKEQKEQFKAYIAALERQPQFRRAKILFPHDQIAEVDIRDHVLLQCLDIVLGAMQFRLNDFHQKKPEGQVKRAPRTIAKEKLYKSKLERVRKLHKGFNIGISTGTHGDPANRWRHRYSHWNFVPSSSRRDISRTKPK